MQESKLCSTPLCISSLCHRFLTVAVCICVSLHCHYIYIHIYFITYWGEKKKNKSKRKGLLCYQLSLPPWLCTCSFQDPFRNDEENDFITLWPSVSVPPCEAVVLNSANPSIAGTVGTVKTHTWGRRLFNDGSNTPRQQELECFKYPEKIFCRMIAIHQEKLI